MKDLLTVAKSRQLLESRQISALELTKEILRCIHATEDKVASYVTITEELALQQADEADKCIQKGQMFSLTGIPMQIKDNLSTANVLTTCSSNMLRNYIPPYNATVVDRLMKEKTILLGKGNMDEFAMGSSTENSAIKKTYNPWDLTKVPGGSSGGPAASVACQEALFSLGSDTGGSIRQPAAFCGIVGLKPTYGLVSRYGLVAFASSLDQVGPMTRTVEDSAIVLRAIAGRDSADATCLTRKVPDYEKSLDQGVKGLRIGIPNEYFDPEIDETAKQSVIDAAEVLKENGATIDWDISLPSTKYALAVYYIIAPSEASANLSRYDGVKFGHASSGNNIWDVIEKTRQEGFGPEVKRRIMLGTHVLSSGYYDAYYLRASKVRTIITEEFKNIFKKVDVLLGPTTPTTAFSVGEKMADPVAMYKSDILTVPANIAGIPAISIPGGFANNLPLGIQFMAPHLGEEILFRVGHSYQQSTSWHLMQPPVLKTYSAGP